MTIPQKSLCFAVLAFGRSEDLKRVVNQISQFFPSAQIVVLVDKFEGFEPELVRANLETIETARQLLSEEVITHLEIPMRNLRTKLAWKRLMGISFNFSDSVIYIEDDLLLLKNPSAFIDWANHILLDSTTIAFATLFTSLEHKAVIESRGRLTNWPELWGVLIHKQKYEILQEVIASAQIRGISKRNFCDLPVNSNLVKVFRGRFEKVWVYKFNRALTVDTSWDTELHLAVWLLGLQCLAPNISYLEDTGIHFTSVSPEKSVRKKYTCANADVDKRSAKGTASEVSYCTSCEKMMEKSGYMFLPRQLNFLRRIIGDWSKVSS